VIARSASPLPSLSSSRTSARPSAPKSGPNSASGLPVCSAPSSPNQRSPEAGRAEVRLLDSDGNGLADRAITSGENGVTGYVDTDGDGRWDVKLTDADGDGTADAASALAPKP
jgi:hypothetical protein